MYVSKDHIIVCVVFTKNYVGILHLEDRPQLCNFFLACLGNNFPVFLFFVSLILVSKGDVYLTYSQLGFLKKCAAAHAHLASYDKLVNYQGNNFSLMEELWRLIPDQFGENCCS